MSELVLVKPQGFEEAVVINLDYVVRIDGRQGSSIIHLTDKSRLIVEHVLPTEVARLPRLKA